MLRAKADTDMWAGPSFLRYQVSNLVIDDAESALSKFKTVQNAWQIKSSLVFELTTLGFSLVRKSSQALNFDGHFVGAALQQHRHDDNTAVLYNAAYRIHLRILAENIYLVWHSQELRGVVVVAIEAEVAEGLEEHLEEAEEGAEVSCHHKIHFRSEKLEGSSSMR